ncbi:MAG: hypothetical protein EHM12_07775 [Dehalococcoidia bacterium]|nr:MAG: hypothetical protein EHM12_07775 [Dehalococcoidia bacterium]
MVNSKTNLFNLFLWIFAAALILFFLAGLFGQTILAVIFSAIAGVCVLAVITRTRFFERQTVYLQSVKAGEPGWVRAAILAVGILAMLAAVYLFFN